MSLLICAATGKELAALAPSLFPKPEYIKEMQPYVSQVKHGRAVFLATGVGPINAALAIGICLGLTHEDKPTSESINIDCIVYAGLAGAFDLAKTPLCSTWVIREEIWPEYGLHDGTTVTARAFKFPQWTTDKGEDIYDRIALSGLDAIGDLGRHVPDWQECTSLTVAGVSASFNRREKLWSLYHAELENMEGFAAAYSAARASIPCVEIRTVANKTGPRSREEKDFDGALLALGQILPSLNLTR